MKPSFDLSRLSYVSLPAHPTTGMSYPLYESAYSLWRTVWNETLNQLQVKGALFSDDFTRQNSVGCFTLGQRCIGLILFRNDTVKSPTAIEDSVLDHWPKKELLSVVPGKFLIGSYVTVHPMFRGRPDSGPSIKELIVEFAVRTLMASDCDILLGSMRKDRNLHEKSKETGARSLGVTNRVYGIETEYYTWSKSELLKSKVSFRSPLGEKIWSTHQDFTQLASSKHMNRTG